MENKQNENNENNEYQIVLTDSLNDNDKYIIKIMSGNLVIEKVGD